ncbi:MULTISPECIES: DUF86 domain-containing protein [unclassified Thermosipho (in: thermotogales)]|uniref:HepT-like ribonuclease domain-containing protein n=1 Tax=unclassified Thermosipho (in: thermotogales) TaxID=2676525 RepID=UPI0018CC5983|nr:DUF86 domain-containing protein [Thermosipho sp. 1223]
MYEACNRILRYIQNIDKSAFMTNEEKQDAVVHNLEIIGEAVKKLSEQLKNKYPEIHWRNISRTRDKLIHHYFGIDYDIVWDIIANDIPKLKAQIEQIIEGLPNYF